MISSDEDDVPLSQFLFAARNTGDVDSTTRLPDAPPPKRKSVPVNSEDLSSSTVRAQLAEPKPTKKFKVSSAGHALPGPKKRPIREDAGDSGGSCASGDSDDDAKKRLKKVTLKNAAATTKPADHNVNDEEDTGKDQEKWYEAGQVDWKRGEEKWKTLEWNGVLFPPPYALTMRVKASPFQSLHSRVAGTRRMGCRSSTTERWYSLRWSKRRCSRALDTHLPHSLIAAQRLVAGGHDVCRDALDQLRGRTRFPEEFHGILAAVAEGH